MIYARQFGGMSCAHLKLFTQLIPRSLNLIRFWAFGSVTGTFRFRFRFQFRTKYTYYIQLLSFLLCMLSLVAHTSNEAMAVKKHLTVCFLFFCFFPFCFFLFNSTKNLNIFLNNSFVFHIFF